MLQNAKISATTTNSVKRSLFEKNVSNVIIHKKNVSMRKMKINEVENNETRSDRENEKIIHSHKEKNRYREKIKDFDKIDHKNELYLIIHGRAVDEGGGEVRNIIEIKIDVK